MNPLSPNEPTERFLKFIFYALIVFQLFPLFTLDYIVTHDGPSHINNAGIIRQLLVGNTIADEFLHLKIFPEPNWMGHIVLVVSGIFFRPEIADKIFIALYIVLLPVFFSRLISKINPRATALSFLCIPFVYSLFFFLGVYNFLAGVAILLLALSSALPHISTGGRALQKRLFFYSILLYLSHLLTLAVFLLVVGIAWLFSLAEKKGYSKKQIVNEIISMALALLPVIALTSYFFFVKLTMANRPSHVTLKEMLDFIWQIRFMITLTFSPENIYSVSFFVLLILLTTGWIIIKRKTIQHDKTFYRRPLFWLIVISTMVICYFFIPDEAATGGVVKFRFLLLFYLFLMCFLALVNFPKIVNYSVVIFIAAWTVLKLNYLYPMMKILDKDAKDLLTITEHIQPNSIVLPYNFSGNWMHDNLSSYTGTRKSILVLDNYEANTPHFPVEWKPGHYPNDIMGVFTSKPPFCTDISKFKKQTGKEIDYLFFWFRPEGVNDSCTLVTDNYIKENYSLIYEGNAKLYKHIAPVSE